MESTGEKPEKKAEKTNVVLKGAITLRSRTPR